MEKTVRKGEYAVTVEEGQVLTAPSLGSTLAVAVAAPAVPVAGLAVLVLPGGQQADGIESGANLLKELFQSVVKAGAKPKEMKIVLAGAAGFQKEPEDLALGVQLYRFAKKSIVKSGLEVNAEHVGGPVNRSVSVHVASGDVVVKMVDEREVRL